MPLSPAPFTGYAAGQHMVSQRPMDMRQTGDPGAFVPKDHPAGISAPTISNPETD